MKLLKYLSVSILTLSLFAVTVSFAYSADWARLYNNSSEKVHGVDYYDSDTGAILVTNSSGSDPFVVIVNGDWEDRVEYRPTTEELYDVEFVDKNSIIAVGENGTIVKTDNLGVSWTDVSVASSVDFSQIEVYDSTHIWAVGDGGVIYKSLNGGNTWVLQPSGVTKDLKGIYAFDANTVFVVGNDETVLKTTTSGATWSIVRYGLTAEFYDVYFSSSTNGIVATSNGLYYTTNGGAAWTAFSGVSTNTFYTLDFYSSSRAAAVGNSVAYTTDDSGATWTSFDIPDESGAELLYDVEYFGDDMIIAGTTSYLKSIFFATDSESPSTVSGLTSDSPSIDGTVALSWDASTDNYGLESYEIDVDGGGYTDIGDVVTYELSASEGSHTVSVRAVDIAGVVGTPTSISILVDQTGPVVSAVSPISATQGSSTLLSVTATDALSTVSSCTLYLNGASQGTMSSQGSGVFTKSYTFTAEGLYSAYAICSDSLGNSTTASTSSITVGATAVEVPAETPTETPTETETPPVVSDSSSGVITDLADLDTDVLIKSRCIGSTDVNDPCRAVYYYDSENKRHAFPNEKVFFTWYESFDDIVTIDSSVMAEISLSTNVTYHPGTKMVKFQTVNTVYAVEQGGVLRAIASESIASALYGTAWNTHIDDISDAFFSNYSFGDDIDSASDYDVDEAIASVSSPDDNF